MDNFKEIKKKKYYRKLKKKKNKKIKRSKSPYYFFEGKLQRRYLAKIDIEKDYPINNFKPIKIPDYDYF